MSTYADGVYALRDFRGIEYPIQQVTFYEKKEDGTETAGTTLEEVLRVATLRLQDLNSRFGSRENSIAITKIQEALMWLNERTRDRVARGVEGKHIA